jgi:hypothetical protein
MSHRGQPALESANRCTQAFDVVDPILLQDAEQLVETGLWQPCRVSKPRSELCPSRSCARPEPASVLVRRSRCLVIRAGVVQVVVSRPRHLVADETSPRAPCRLDCRLRLLHAHHHITHHQQEPQGRRATANEGDELVVRKLLALLLPLPIAVL